MFTLKKNLPLNHYAITGKKERKGDTIEQTQRQTGRQTDND